MPNEKLNTKAEKLVRTKTVGVRLDPKIHYLAELAARYQQRTLSGFIEWAVTRALTPVGMQEDESNVSEPLGPMQPKRLWMEGMWDVDEADRIFLLASRPDLMTIEHQRFFKFFMLHMESIGKPASQKAFREFWNSPGIDTTHLKTAPDGGE
jgi:hypothetical protein